MKKCIIILSEKSSGSSACQNLLARCADINHVAETRHCENETLYWTKAASILDMPQVNMLDSEVPIGKEAAKRDLITLLYDNLDDYDPPPEDYELVVDGWRLLCEQYAPIFLEKSPHHLCQWSALELIVRAMEEIEGVDFLLIGLVRNPMDTLYSQFQRWRIRPEEAQFQWRLAYENLLRLKERVGDKLVIVRYEDMVTSLESLRPVFEFCGVPSGSADASYFHGESVAKWRQDKSFGFVLSEDIKGLARRYGYREDEITNDGYLLWPVLRELSRLAYKTKNPVIRVAAAGLRRIRLAVGLAVIGVTGLALAHAELSPGGVWDPVQDAFTGVVREQSMRSRRLAGTERRPGTNFRGMVMS